MRQIPSGLCFSEEAFLYGLDLILIHIVFEAQGLDRHLSIYFWILAQINDSHGTPPQLFRDFVTTKRCAGVEAFQDDSGLGPFLADGAEDCAFARLLE